MRKASVRGFAIVAIGASLVLTGCGGKEVVEKAPVIRAVKIVTVGGDSAQTRSFPGRVEASDQVDLSFRVGGPLVEFPVLEGDFVKKGQLTARIDPRDYRIRLDAARAEVERTDADFRRYSALYEKDAVSKAQLDQALAARDVALAHEEDAVANLDDTFLRAPFDARVAETFVENFQDSFSADGYSLNFEFHPKRRHSAKIRECIDELIGCAMKFGGKVHLAKDMILTAEQFEGMFANHGAFKSVKRKLDPEGLFDSDLRRRLLHGD